MTKSRSHILATLMVGVSLTAIALPQRAAAQTAALPAAAPNANSEIIVTGIRGSLRTSRNIKRDSQGVVDAISAEDIGKLADVQIGRAHV